MFKQSLTFITLFLLAVVSSCAGSNNNFKKNFLTENDIRETLSRTELKLNYKTSLDNGIMKTISYFKKNII